MKWSKKQVDIVRTLKLMGDFTNKDICQDILYQESKEG